ncbi:MAG: hypothetical protein RQ847_03175 [Wenzhouxiangellaceae bacterium]|nr:hypothetical protein [Wenzhouxiangellaceae bacterium]
MKRIICVPIAFLILFATPGHAAPSGDEAWLDGLEWRLIGPWRGGRATTVAGHPDDNRFYVMGSTGGVFITRDAGLSWEPVDHEAFGTASVGDIAIAPSDINVIVVGMGESPVRGVAASHGDGIYRSIDRGRTWTHLGLENSRHIGEIQIHPNDPEMFWVGVQGAAYGAGEQRGVYKTTDGGRTFDKVLYVNDTTGAVDLRLDPNNPRILYAAMWDWQRTPWAIRSGGEGSGIWKSTDGGENWEEIGTEDFPDLMGKIGIAPSAAKPGRVWAVIEAEDKGGVWRSDDWGESWTHVNGSRKVQARSWYYMHIFDHPADENTVYVQNAPFMRSFDGGKTFEEMAKSIHGDHHDLWINPANPNIMIGANDGGATISFDGGETWSSQYNQPTAQFYRVNVDNDYFYRVYGGQQDNSTVAIRSFGDDGGIGRDDWMRVGGCESAHIAFDREDPRYIYAGCYLGQIEEFDMATETARDIRAYPELAFGIPPRERKYRFNWNAPIVVSRHDPSVIYHAGNVVLKSTDRGWSWAEISPDLTRDNPEHQGKGGFPITNEVSENYNTIMYVAESPHDAGTLWAGSDDGLVHVTRDGGERWENVTPRRAGKGMVNAIAVSPHEPGTAYVAFTKYKYNDHTPIIYVTESYGRSWDRIDDGIPEGHWVRVVREDPEREGLLYAGTEMGLFVSFDAGRNWQKLHAGELPVVPITDLRVHRGDLVAATQGRSFWILDDLSPLRQYQAAQTEVDAHLYAPAAADILRIEGNRPAGAGKNPPIGALLYYTLAEAPDLEDQTLKLEIVDSAGNVIRTLESDAEKGEDGGSSGSAYALPAKKGLNRAVWDFAADPIEHELDDFVIASGDDKQIDGYTAGPGDYNVRLTLGETTVEQRLAVRFDPRREYDPAHMAEQQRLVKSAYAMLDEFQATLIGLRQVREQAKIKHGIFKDNGETDKAEAMQAVIDVIDEWEDGNIATEREFFQDVLNWPDRLFTELQFLYSTLNAAMPRVTEGMKQRHADISGKFGDAMAARDAVLEGAVTEANRANDDILVVPKMTPSDR